MKDEDKTRDQLINELNDLRHKIRILETRTTGIDNSDLQQAQAALRLSEDAFFKIFNSNPYSITITTLKDGLYVDVNDAWVKVTGFKREEAIGHNSVELDIWVSTAARQQMLQTLDEQGSIRNFEADFRTRSGEIKKVLASADIIEMGNKLHLLCTYKDITDSKRIMEELHVSEERFSQAFNVSPSTISITTLEEGQYIDVNDSFCRVTGYSEQEIVGRTSLELGFWVDPAQRDLVKQNIINKQPVRDLEIRFRKKYGVERLGLYSAAGIDVDNTPCLLSIITDITDRKQAEDRVNYLSYHDNLTGLYNRAFFEEELQRIDTESQLPLSLILGDVNGLKLLNDMLGHQVGDRLLVTVAKILADSCRREDVAARWGGDEFIILMPRCDADAANRIMENIKEACQHIDIFPIDTSLSVGLAVKYSARQDINDIIKEAEDKMYRNKLLEDRSTRSSFLTSLKKTLWTRSHETQAHCQRIQDVALRIGRAVNLPDCDLDNLKLLAVLHDIGKIAIPNSILDKPGKLTSEEWELIKKHTEIGYRIALSSPEMAPIAEAILHHHERWDGAGYPLGLKGDEIPLISRIVAIADSYDVMTYGRPYQSPFAKDEVCAEIARCAGNHFDPYLSGKAMELLTMS